MLLTRNLAGQGLACETTAAAVGYVIIDQGGPRVGTGVIAAVGTTGAMLTLSAADVAFFGPTTIFAVDAGGNAVGQINGDVGRPPIPGANVFIGAIAPAANGYTVVKADASQVAGGSAINGMPGAANAVYIETLAGETNLAGPLSLLFTAAGVVVGAANDYVQVFVPPASTQIVTVTDSAGNLLYTGAPLSGMSQAELRNLLNAARIVGGINVLAQDSGLPPPPTQIARYINDQRGE